ncbi:MAG: NmrA family NAD(P)-binding protein [Thermoanaerobaculia bacterium]
MARENPAILITGAAGKTGAAVIRRLAPTGAAMRAFVRRAEQREIVAGAGAGDIVEGDLRSREAVASAVRGVESIYHICPNVHPDETGIGRRVIAAALAAGVERIVYHSVLHPQVEAMPHHWAKMRVEELLFESGLDYTILQPAPYMQNLLGQWRSITEQAVYRVPYALDSRVVMVDLEDVAEAAVRVLTESGHTGATYELCGPDAPDQNEIARALGAALGRSVRAVAVSPRQWAEDADAAGLGNDRIETLLAMFSYYESFGMAGSPRALEHLLGRPPCGLAEFFDRVASSAGAP